MTTTLTAADRATAAVAEAARKTGDATLTNRTAVTRWPGAVDISYPMGTLGGDTRASLLGAMDSAGFGTFYASNDGWLRVLTFEA